MKIVIAPDSFKGTMKSSEVSSIIEGAAREIFPEAIIASIPFSDGGEGSLECFYSSIGGEILESSVSNPLFKKIVAKYLLKDNLAVIESAEACGLTLIDESVRNPLYTTTYGVGELIKDSLDKGAKKIVLTLGGSATNDGGAGMVSALGVRFYKKDSQEFVPTGKTLIEIDKIDLSSIDKRIFETEIIGMCDVTNTICGKLGASYVYGPQKGANQKEVELLDEGLCNLTKILSKNDNFDYFSLEGGGAAGGLGLAVVAFLKGTLVSGIELMKQIAEFDKKTSDASLIITGEGRLDRQSFMGKVIDGLSKRALEIDIPLIIIAGSITKEVTSELLASHGVIYAEPTDLSGRPFSEIKHRAKTDLALASRRVLNKFREYINSKK